YIAVLVVRVNAEMNRLLITHRNHNFHEIRVAKTTPECPGEVVGVLVTLSKVDIDLWASRIEHIAQFLARRIAHAWLCGSRRRNGRCMTFLGDAERDKEEQQGCGDN